MTVFYFSGELNLTLEVRLDLSLAATRLEQMCGSCQCQQSRTGRESSSGKSTETQWTREVTERLFGSAVCCASRLRKSISILQPHASAFNKTPVKSQLSHSYITQTIRILLAEICYCKALFKASESLTAAKKTSMATANVTSLAGANETSG